MKCYLDAKTFEADAGERENCYTVLEKILGHDCFVTQYNVAAVAAAEKFEYKTMKEWVSAMDSRVRGRNPEDHANHWDLDGVVVDYNQPFVDPRNGVD